MRQEEEAGGGGRRRRQEEDEAEEAAGAAPRDTRILRDVKPKHLTKRAAGAPG